MSHVWTRADGSGRIAMKGAVSPAAVGVDIGCGMLIIALEFVLSTGVAAPGGGEAQQLLAAVRGYAD